jgi:hypothetical protein
MGLIVQVNERKRIVDNMDDDARDNAACAPIEPTDHDSKQHGSEKMHPQSREANQIQVQRLE